MNQNLLKNATRMNLLFWAVAIFLPILLRMIPASKEPKIYELLIPMFQVSIAITATWYIANVMKATGTTTNSDDEAK